MVSEITIIVKDEEKTLRSKYLAYEKYQIDQEDPVIKDCIEKTVKNFNTTPTDIQVKISLEVI